MRMEPVDSGRQRCLVQLSKVLYLLNVPRWHSLVTQAIHFTIVLQRTSFQFAISKHTLLKGSWKHTSSCATCPRAYALRPGSNFFYFFIALGRDELHRDSLRTRRIRAPCIVFLLPWRVFFRDVTGTVCTHWSVTGSSPAAHFPVGDCLALLLAINSCILKQDAWKLLLNYSTDVLLLRD